jgi:hypothetical protein
VRIRESPTASIDGELDIFFVAENAGARSADEIPQLLLSVTLCDPPRHLN